MALLPKRGSLAAGDRWPIVLLPVVYRLWAACQANEMRRWACAGGIVPAGAAASPEAKAGSRALAVDVLEAQECVSGFAVDWSQCFCHLPLSILRQVAQCAGFPEAVYWHMLAAYFHPRFVRLDGMAGDVAVPVRLACLGHGVLGRQGVRGGARGG